MAGPDDWRALELARAELDALNRALDDFDRRRQPDRVDAAEAHLAAAVMLLDPAEPLTPWRRPG